LHYFLLFFEFFAHNRAGEGEPGKLGEPGELGETRETAEPREPRVRFPGEGDPPAGITNKNGAANFNDSPFLIPPCLC